MHSAEVFDSQAASQVDRCTASACVAVSSCQVSASPQAGDYIRDHDGSPWSRWVVAPVSSDEALPKFANYGGFVALLRCAMLFKITEVRGRR